MASPGKEAEEKETYKETDFRIEQVKEDYFDELMVLYKEFFATREPLICGLHLGKDEVMEYLNDLAKEWIKCQASVCAFYIPGNKIVGSIFTKILTRNDHETFKDENISLYSPGVQTLLKILKYIEGSFDIFKQYEKAENILEIATITVDPDFSGNKLVYKMSEESERIAKNLGCQLATSQATNKITQHFQSKMGYENRLRIEYEEVEVDGVKPLDISAMNGSTGVNIFVKNLE